MALKRAVFFDKDGTLIENVPFNVEPERIRFASGAERALRELTAAGYLIFVISNQPGVAFGYFPKTALARVESRMAAMLRRQGALLSGFYYCPHHPDGVMNGYDIRCACRKPMPGLILRAAREFSVDLGGSWMVGDILDDVEAGHRAGCRTVLVDNGNETEWVRSPAREPTWVVKDLAEAAERICAAGAPAPVAEGPALGETTPLAKETR